MQNVQRDIEILRKSGVFDANWYKKTYLDLDIIGMDPAEHYVRFGHKMNRDPGADFSTEFVRTIWNVKGEVNPVSYLSQYDLFNKNPSHKAVLFAASKLLERGLYDQAINIAKQHLPIKLHYTLEIFLANYANKHKKEADWLNHFNQYLSRFGVAPIQLGEGGTIFESLSTTSLPKVSGGPLVSIIMPAWNASNTIKKAIQSILSQTWENLELLVIDDASNDNTAGVVLEIADRDKRVKIFKNKINVGPYVSKNIALQYAQGAWVTGHDADDWAHPQRIEKHIALAKQTGSKASCTYMVRMQVDGFIPHFSKIGNFSLDGVARISSISTLFDAQFLKTKLGSWDSVRFGADSEMISRAKVLLGDEFIHFETIGMLCLDIPSSLTNDPETGIKTAKGLSNTRLNYKKAWVDLHKTMSSKECYMNFPQKTRKYTGDFDHYVEIPEISMVHDLDGDI